MNKKKLNVGLVGYGFMGRTHSNAFGKVNQFFDLEYEPVLKAVCARDADKLQAFAGQWGYESVETDWHKLVGRKDIDLIAIATHGRGGFARVMRGSVADGVTKSAMSSILVFHPEKALPKALRQGSADKSRDEELALV